MKARVVATVAVGMLVLAGCTGESVDDANGSTTTTTAVETDDSTSTATGDDSATGESTAEPETGDGSSGPALGETFEYDDGLVVSVSGPELFMPSATATMGPEPNYISFTVTVVNGTETEFSPLDVTVTVASGGGQGGDVLDPDSGIGAPEEAIAPGEEASWELAFGVLDGEDVAVSVQPGIDREPVTFKD